MMGHVAAASEGLMAVRASHDTWGQRHSGAGAVGVIPAALQPCPAGSQEHEADVQGGQKAGAPGGCRRYQQPRAISPTRKAGQRPSDQSVLATVCPQQWSETYNRKAFLGVGGWF